MAVDKKAQMDTELEASGETREPRLYELGYHIIPTIAEDAVPDEVAALKKIVTDAGGELAEEGAPQSMRLAYPIAQTFAGEKKEFESAFFGWLRFTVPPHALAAIEKAVTEKKEVLRFLLIQAEDAPLAQTADEKADGKEASTEGESAGTGSRTVSEAELDKTIDDLVID